MCWAVSPNASHSIEIAMRKVTFGVANSLDNYIARPDHRVDWLFWNDEVASISSAYWKTIDTVVMGRKTYEIAVKMGNPSYPGIKNYVFSRTLKGVHEGVEVVSGDAVDFIRKIKPDQGKGICIMGGGELANSLLEADLIDELGVNVHPILLGSGIPLFHAMKKQINLELTDSKILKNGCVYLLYRIRR